MVLAPAEPIGHVSADLRRHRPAKAGGRLSLTRMRSRPAGIGEPVPPDGWFGTRTPRQGRQGHRRGGDAAPLTSSHSATCTAQSCRPGMANSRVPSSGSMIHTRSARRRAGSSSDSSERTASPGRASASRRAAGAVGLPIAPRRPQLLGILRRSRSPDLQQQTRPAASASSAARRASVGHSSSWEITQSAMADGLP